MKKIIYAIYRVSPKSLRQLIRDVISRIRAASNLSNINSDDSGRLADVQVYDNNVPINTSLICHICGACNVLSPYADLVRVDKGVGLRKIFHICRGCGFLFTRERRARRAQFFEKTPYKADQQGLRSGREADLVELLDGIKKFDKNSNILIYAIGKGNTLDLLQQRGYVNVWGADVSDGVNYGGRIVNISSEKQFFSRNNLRFEIIISVEVWEHYAQEEIDSAFAWQFEQLSDNGILVGTTSFWVPSEGNEYFKGKFESGIDLLKLWHYPFFVDHTSFYTEEAMRLISERHGMDVYFAYFDEPYVHIMDPGKRIVFITKNGNTEVSQYISSKFSRKFLAIRH